MVQQLNRSRAGREKLAELRGIRYPKSINAWALTKAVKGKANAELRRLVDSDAARDAHQLLMEVELRRYVGHKPENIEIRAAILAAREATRVVAELIAAQQWGKYIAEARMSSNPLDEKEEEK